MIGYVAAATAAPTASSTVATDLQTLEDFAHEHKALLSSDALRHLMQTDPLNGEHTALLQRVIGKAKISYPTEDGWVVVNLERMQALCDECIGERAVTDVTPTGAGSLAEAIVSGNIGAAYQLIGHRPMVALADATTDLDSLYRQKRGETTLVSNMLTSEAEKFSAEQIKSAIDALTSALDGVYTNEAGAVKMAIMKALKALS